jgi:hypothetical protein
MRLHKSENLLIGLIFIFLTACGGPPLAQPEGQTTTPGQEAAAETATLAATQEAVEAKSTSPLPTPANTVVATATEPLAVATPVSPVATPTPKPLPGLVVTREFEILKDRNLGWLKWSPNNSQLLYTKFSDEILEVSYGAWERGEIWLFNLDKGDNKQLISNGQVAAWSPDGKKLSLSIINPKTKKYDMAVYDFSSQSVTAMGDSSYFYNSWISNQELSFMGEQNLTIVAATSGKVVNEVELGKASKNNPKRITQLNAKIIAYDKQEKLVSIDTSNKQIEAAPTNAIFDWIAVSPSGQDLAYVTQDIPPAFGILNLKTGDTRVLLQAGNRDFANPRIFNPIWSTNGRFITITASKTTGTEVSTDVYLFDAASGYMYEKPLIQNIDATSLVWSPNGKRLAFTRTSSSESELKTSVFVGELQ